ncbi:MAG: response regulator receiver protein [Gemmataceae bacterium]|nr:response regulator receiver protein [Gemmataceae bacterium]
MSQPLTVLLVEDNRIEARQAQRWLADAKEGAYEVECVDRLRFALERLDRGGIDIVLLDLNLPDSQGLETFLTLHSQAPQVPIVVLTGEDDDTLGAAAVEKGAQDYLVKRQVDGTKLARVLRYALVRQRSQSGPINEPSSGNSARVVGFVGAKGGVGTTTVALNVALALAKKQRSVILVEMRPSFGTLACHLRQQPAKSLRTVLDHFPERLVEHDLRVLLCNGPAELRILFGPQPEDLFKEIDPGQAEAVIKGLAKMAEFAILDLPNQPSVAMQAAVRLCNFVAVVTEQTLGAVVCAKVALSQFQTWGVGGNRVGTVIVNRTENPSPIKLTEIRTRLGCDIVGVVPPGTSACFQALEVGSPGELTMSDHVAASFGGKLVIEQTPEGNVLTRVNNVAASFVAIADYFSADRHVGM